MSGGRETLEDLRVPPASWALVTPEGLRPLPPPGPLTIGRALECDLVLDAPAISRHHATITFAGDRPRIEDAGSRHGTTLNGQRLEAMAPLKHGDRIGIGGTLLVVQDLARGQRANRETLQMPPVGGRRSAGAVPVTGEHDAVAALIGEIQMMVDAGEAAHAGSLVEAALRAWQAMSPGTPLDEGTLRRGSVVVLRAVTTQSAWIDAIVRVHQRRGVLMHASTVDQLEAAVERAPAIDWGALGAYTQWLRSSGKAEARGEYGQYCLARLDQILAARR